MKQDVKTYENERCVRVIEKDDGQIRMVLVDIAKCAGYKAPTKFCQRCEIKGEKLNVSWKRKTTGTGRAEMYCISIDEYLVIAQRYEFPQNLTAWVKSLVKEKQQGNFVYDFKNDDIESDLDIMLDMLNNLTYACLELRREIEKAKNRVVCT